MRPHPRPRLTLIGAALAASMIAFASVGVGSAAAATYIVSQCAVNLRSSASTSATVVDVIADGTLAYASSTVSGSSWSASCGGSNVSGSSWYKITSVNGKSTSSLYGKSAVYAATGLFKTASAPPPPSGYLEGVDVSHWQGSISWTSVAAAGKKFAVMKVTESTSYADSQYPTWHSAARGQGIRVGGYHFAQPSTTSGNAVAQADWFVSHLNLLAGDLNPALDLEVSNGLGATALQNWVLAWLNEVYAKTGMRPMIYTSPSFWRNNMGDTRKYADLGYNVLWVAHWFVSSPSVPGSNWGGKGWTFWQYDDCGSVLGIGGCVDLDRYNGTDLTKVTYGASFSLGSPGSQSVKQGGSTSFGVSINRSWFTLPVSLSVTGLPAGATASLSTTSTTGGSATLRVTTSGSGTVTPVGTYPIKITATANGVSKTTTASLAVTDGIAPAVIAPTSHMYSIATLNPGLMPGKTHWSATDASGISSYTLESQVNGGSWSAIGPDPSTSIVANQLWSMTDVHRFRMKATDGNGNTSAWVYGPSFKVAVAQDSSSSVHYSCCWGTTTTPYASGGTLHYTKTAGAWASYTFTGSGIAWVAYHGPNRGWAKVYVDGSYVTSVNLYSATYASKQIVFAKSWTSNGTHTIKIVCAATAGHPRVDLDGFARVVLQ